MKKSRRAYKKRLKKVDSDFQKILRVPSPLPYQPLSQPDSGWGFEIEQFSLLKDAGPVTVAFSTPLANITMPYFHA